MAAVTTPTLSMVISPSPIATSHDVRTHTTRPHAPHPHTRWTRWRGRQSDTPPGPHGVISQVDADHPIRMASSRSRAPCHWGRGRGPVTLATWPY